VGGTGVFVEVGGTGVFVLGGLDTVGEDGLFFLQAEDTKINTIIKPAKKLAVPYFMILPLTLQRF
jgi:hypothetical protein